MKKCKIISKVVVFILLFVIIYGKVSSVLSIGNNFTATIGSYRSFFAEPNNSIQIVTLGNSRMYSSWNSLELWKKSGVTSYCLSTGLQPAVMVQYLMEEVRKTQENPLFIIDINCFRKDQIYAMNDINIRRVIDCIPMSSNKIDMIEATLKLYPQAMDYQIEKVNEAIEKAELMPDKIEYEDKLKSLLEERDNVSKLRYYWTFPQYHSRWSKLKKSDFTGEGTPYKSVYYDKRMFQTKPINGPTLTTQSDILDVNQKSILEDLFSYIEKNRLNVLFVSLPASLRTDYAKDLNGVKDFIANKGETCIDFNTNDMYENLSIDFSKDFYDIDHMNIKGSMKLMNYMTSYITDHYSMENQRGVEGSESWDEELQDYLKYLEKMQEEE